MPGIDTLISKAIFKAARANSSKNTTKVDRDIVETRPSKSINSDNECRMENQHYYSNYREIS